MKSLRQEAKASQSAKMGRMTHGYAKGGFVPPKVGSDDRLPVANVAGTKAAGKIGGVKAKTRLDRPTFAAGGRAKKSGGKTDVTVIVAPGGGAGANPATPPMPPPPMAAPPMPPPRPPMVPPPPPPPPPGAGPPGGPPPSGMPIRKAGGRVHKDAGGSVAPKGDVKPLEISKPAPGPIERQGVSTYKREVGRDMKSGSFGKYEYRKGGRTKKADGGAVAAREDTFKKESEGDNVVPTGKKDGGGIKSIGMKVGTKVSHNDEPNDLANLYKDVPAFSKKAKGGRAYPIDDGAGSGEGRLEKIGKHA